MQVLEDSDVEGAIFSKAQGCICGRLEDCLLAGTSGRHSMSDVNLELKKVRGFLETLFLSSFDRGLTCFCLATHWRPAPLDYPGRGYTTAKPRTSSEPGPDRDFIRVLGKLDPRSLKTHYNL